MPSTSLFFLALLVGCSPEVGISRQKFDEDGDGYSSEVDCDDVHATVNPDAPESCDGVDNDCDGTVDEDATDAPTWYLDADGDGVGQTAVQGCQAPEDAVTVNGDCDDGMATVYPGAAEICNRVDEDCDGVVDNEAIDVRNWYTDADGDGYGDGNPRLACEGLAGQVAAEGDCNDADARIHPGAEEADCADPTDYNCDGSVGYMDADTDGFPACTDCDDGTGAVHPGAVEDCDGADDNCDGSADEGVTDTWYGDADGDGYGNATSPMEACSAPVGYVADSNDCDDLLVAVHPGAAEQCDGLDQDCDGMVDENVTLLWYADLDADGYGDAGTVVDACAPPAGYIADASDCDDQEVDTHPGAPEQCDGLDQNCDGTVDEAAADAPIWYNDTDGDGFGDSTAGTAACDAPAGAVADGTDCDDTDAAVAPHAEERCNGRDDNCDGQTDGGDAVDADIWFADVDGDQFGDRNVTTSACMPPIGYTGDASDCDDSAADVYPGATEFCDGRDHNCNGTSNDAGAVDERPWYGDGDGDGYGDAADIVVSCTAPAGYLANALDCDDGDASISPGAAERCDANNRDEDCDGLADDLDPSVTGGSLWYRDGDGDGYGGYTSRTACDLPVGYSADSTDCDDSQAAIYPGATEVCDPSDIDEDCDGLSDDRDSAAAGKIRWYADTDGDTYGLATRSIAACDLPSGYAANSTDCDDSDGTINPSAVESCDGAGRDEDCDGLSDDADPSRTGAPTWYRDADADGYGGTTTIVACTQPTSYLARGGDCDDSRVAVNPAAVEVCDGASLDEDCDGLINDSDPSATGTLNWYRDADGDSFGGSGSVTACGQPSGYVANSTDCDDGQVAVHPGATEVCDPQDVDEDCDGLADDLDPGVSGGSAWYPDGDGDGYGAVNLTIACTAPSGSVSNNDDCNDGDGAINPAATERCDAANTDEDCDGLADDADPSVAPSSQTSYYADADGDGYGDAGSLTLACDAGSGASTNNSDCNDGDAAINPDAFEVCDAANTDEDCDGLADDADPSVAPSSQTSYYADVDGDGYGDAANLTLACDAGSGVSTNDSDCDDSNSGVHPGATETVNGKDDNCDALIDNTGAWHSERITGSAYWQLDSKINADDEFILGYLNTNSYMRVLVGNTTQGWASHSITSTSTNSPAVAFGTAGDYHIMYRTNVKQAFQGYFNGSSWSTTLLDTDCGSDNGWQNTGINVAEDGTVYSYYNDTTSAYSFFYLGTYGAMSLYRSTSGVTVYGASQALDPVSGDIAYAYMASSWNPLWRLSDASGTSYASGALDSGGRSSTRVGSGVTVAYGQDGSLYAAWHDAVEGDIKFATYDASLGSWTTERVSSPAGYYPHDLDLVIDSVGNAHIVYAMNYGTNGYYPFTYATNKSGNWVLTSLATASDNPTFCEIQVDSMDLVHIFGILNASKYLMHYYIY